jgi:hypothetical protein
MNIRAGSGMPFSILLRDLFLLQTACLSPKDPFLLIPQLWRDHQLADDCSA